MNPIKHPSNNASLAPPFGITEDQCATLHITRVSHAHPVEPDKLMAGVISYWQPSPEELAALNAGKPLFLSFWGPTHPPVAVGVEACPPWGEAGQPGHTSEVMQLAESVGLIGPASRTGDLHAAIERFARAIHSRMGSSPPAQRIPEPVALQGRDEPVSIEDAMTVAQVGLNTIIRRINSGNTTGAVEVAEHARQVLARASLPAGGVVEPSGLGFMCHAYGESDAPVFAFARAPEEVGLFLCREWFGESYAELSDDDKGRHDEILRQVRADKFDPDAWDGSDQISIEFEIGGIEITRCAFEPLATGQPAETHTEDAPRFDVTLTEEEAGFLRDTLGTEDDATPLRLLTGHGHSGYGLYVAEAEQQQEGASLLKALPEPSETQGHPDASVITDAQIAAGAAVIGDNRKPVGRNTAISVFEAMCVAVAAKGDGGDTCAR